MRDGNPQLKLWKGESVDDEESSENSLDFEHKRPQRRNGQHGQPVFDFYGHQPQTGKKPKK